MNNKGTYQTEARLHLYYLHVAKGSVSFVFGSIKHPMISAEMAEEDDEQDQRHKNQPLKSEQGQYKRLKYQPTEQPRGQRSEYHQTKQTPDQRPKYPSLTSEQREKLKQFFQHIIANASVDFTNPEIQDIKTAMDTMLERIKTRVNSRGIFKIARIVRSGSMREKTSLWKIKDSHHHLEFDFLAALEDTVKRCIDQTANCRGCMKIVDTPVDKERLRQCYGIGGYDIGYDIGGDILNAGLWESYHRGGIVNAGALESQDVINALFIKEINCCLTSSCDCLTFQCNEDEYECYEISFQPSSVKHKGGCGECTVDMPTGTLHVNTEISVKQITSDSSNCSLIFQWISKAKSLSAPAILLFQEPNLLSSLPIYVDFLPALEFLKPTLSVARDEHDYFIVPKRCNVCEMFDYDDYNEYGYRWRKSWCLAEINAFTTDMSDKHRRCFQVIKYFSEPFDSLSSYHIKTVVLNHHTTCADTTDDCVDCVIGILRELLQAYKTKKLLSYQSNLNIINGKVDTYIDIWKRYCDFLIHKLCSVSATDTWHEFIR